MKILFGAVSLTRSLLRNTVEGSGVSHRLPQRSDGGVLAATYPALVSSSGLQMQSKHLLPVISGAPGWKGNDLQLQKHHGCLPPQIPLLPWFPFALVPSRLAHLPFLPGKALLAPAQRKPRIHRGLRGFVAARPRQPRPDSRGLG